MIVYDNAIKTSAVESIEALPALILFSGIFFRFFKDELNKKISISSLTMVNRGIAELPLWSKTG
jgi:hypothetical protein